MKDLYRLVVVVVDLKTTRTTNITYVLTRPTHHIFTENVLPYILFVRIFIERDQSTELLTPFIFNILEQLTVWTKINLRIVGGGGNYLRTHYQLLFVTLTW